ncbi:MAG: GNAT family N-acetyltransferase [Pseudomonadales bacterium]|nr:GNAT family N-acetyltransferase [Pseudomonadales bacterium]
MSDLDFLSCSTRVADWENDGQVLKSIREAVFIKEQHVPENLEWDEEDETAIHFLTSINEQPVATARITTKGQLGRCAVLENYRGQGVGSAMLRFILLQASSCGFTQLFLYSQTHAIGFYKQFGFEEEGSEFLDAGIPHKKMSRFLPPDRSSISKGSLEQFQHFHECREWILKLLAEAEKCICIFSESLDPLLLDSSEIASLLIAFRKRSTKTSIRLLVKNTRPLKLTSHRLVKIGQRSDNILEIRTFDVPKGSYPYFYIITDDINILFRANEESYLGSVNLDNRARVKAQQEEFDQLWNVAYTDPELKKLTL